MPMATKPVTSKSNRSTMGEDQTSTTSSSCHRDSSSRSEGRHSSRKPVGDDSVGSGQSTAPSKDYNRGEMRSLETSSGGGSLDSEYGEEKPKSRRSDKDKPVPLTPQEASDRSARERSNSPVKRKPVPAENTSQFQEHLNEAQMESPDTSEEEFESEFIQDPRTTKEIDMEAELDAAATAAAIAEATRSSLLEDEEKMKRDIAMAKKLDMELNAQMPGDFPDPGDSAHTQGHSRQGQHQQHQQEQSSSGRASSTSIFWGSTPERQLEKAKEKNHALKKRLDEVETIALQWQRQAQQEHTQFNRLYNQARSLEMEFRSAQKHINHLEGELKTAKHELGAVKQQLSDAVNLSEVRGKELKGAQVFLTKADTLSVTDVVQKVNALNEEIFQMAAFLGEVLVYETYEEGLDRTTERQGAIRNGFDRAGQMLGQNLASVLAQESVSEPREASNPLLVQIVMQIALTQWCAYLGSRWTSYHRVEQEPREGDEQQQNAQGGTTRSVDKQVEHDRLLAELYNSIRDHEDQAVAGRWRSLTKGHLPFSSNGWEDSLMLGILSVMSVAGWCTRAPEETEQIEKRLGSIFKPLNELRKATGEDVTSADLEIATIDPGLPYDPAYMEDAYADGRSSSKSKKSAPEAVVSTSGLGLKRIVVKKLKGGGVQRQAEMLSMPKVVLEKTIKEALEPPAPTKKKKKAQAGDQGGGILSGLIGGF